MGLTLMAICNLFSYAQDSTKLIKYTPEFRFDDGIYINFEQVKHNRPIEKSRILTTADYNDRDFFAGITSKKVVSFYDNLGNKTDVPVKNIWGYADNGTLYINIGESFYRISIIGSISHFVAYITSFEYNPYNPYYSNYSYYYQRGSSRSERTDLRQFLLDFTSGRVYDYTSEYLSVLLMKDPSLHDEYESLRKKKRNQLKFLYLRKFNERKPLYFPDNKQAQ